MSEMINAWNAYTLSKRQSGTNFDSFEAGWQASRLAALEEAEKACTWLEDSLMEDAHAARQALDFDKRNEMEAQSFGAEKAKNAIRALAQGGGA